MTTALKWQTEAISTQFPLIFHTILQQRTSSSSTKLIHKKNQHEFLLFSFHFQGKSKVNIKEEQQLYRKMQRLAMIAQKAQIKMYKQFLLWHPREKFNVNESANNANYPRHRHFFDNRIYKHQINKN